MCTDSSYNVMGRDNLKLSQGYAQLQEMGFLYMLKYEEG